MAAAPRYRERMLTQVSSNVIIQIKDLDTEVFRGAEDLGQHTGKPISNHKLHVFVSFNAAKCVQHSTNQLLFTRH